MSLRLESYTINVPRSGWLQKYGKMEMESVVLRRSVDLAS